METPLFFKLLVYDRDPLQIILIYLSLIIFYVFFHFILHCSVSDVKEGIQQVKISISLLYQYIYLLMLCTLEFIIIEIESFR